MTTKRCKSSSDNHQQIMDAFESLHEELRIVRNRLMSIEMCLSDLAKGKDISKRAKFYQDVLPPIPEVEYVKNFKG